MAVRSDVIARCLWAAAVLLFMVAAACPVASGRAAAAGARPQPLLAWGDNNDSMFPSAASAKKVIDFDGRGFLVHGRRTYVVAGDMHYSRIPRAQWRTRLLRIKRAGYNTVQTYAFWNFHEPQEGKFIFTGDRDLDAYLKLIHALGMYAIVRMGPYVNAEWDTGGLPVWLRFKPGLRPMTDDPPFWDAVNPYLDRLIPIVAANQITRGGAVIMVQLENEHFYPDGGGGGTDLYNSYFAKYRARVVRGGIVVPYYFSGLHHDDDPARAGLIDASKRASPWMTTEFWTGWVGWYGVDAAKQDKLVRATWKVIAYGGAGYTHYMMSGGSDFDTWNNNEQAASYDFGAPIGQAGDLRDDYYPLKRAALFATSFAALTANSVAMDGGGGATATNSGVRVTRREGMAGGILFLDNSTAGPARTQVMIGGRTYPSAGPVTLAAGEIMPVVHDYALLPTLTLMVAAARVLGVATQGTTKTLVVYGSPNEPGELDFRAGTPDVRPGAVPRRPGDALTVAGPQITLQTRFPVMGPDVFTFRVGPRTVRVLAESTAMADRTWFVPVEGQTEIVCGPAYVGDDRRQDGAFVLETERAWRGPMAAAGDTRVFGPDGGRRALPFTPAGARPAPPQAPRLGPWSADAESAAAQPGFNDGAWLKSDQPRPMGADGDISAYAWYRAEVNAPAAGTYLLQVADAGDWLCGFVNGRRQDSTDVQVRFQGPLPRRLFLTLHQGPNTLALLTAHYGRNKLFNYYDTLENIDRKGVGGPVTLQRDSARPREIQAFRWRVDDQGTADAATMAAPGLANGGADWQDAGTFTDVFHGRPGYAWFRATLPGMPGPHRLLHVNSIDDSGALYLNGRQIASDVGLNAGADIPLDAAWRTDGPNVLAILVRNDGGPGGLLGRITLFGGLDAGPILPITGWRMRGGENPPPPASPDWHLMAGDSTPGRPAWYRTTFTAQPPGPSGPHPILRVQTGTLSRGFVWLNGHNLGRYPEVSRDHSGTGALVGGIYLQECWLHPGKNSLMIFDEDGASPSRVRIVVEAAASRRGTLLRVAPATARSSQARLSSGRRSCPAWTNLSLSRTLWPFRYPSQGLFPYRWMRAPGSPGRS